MNQYHDTSPCSSTEISLPGEIEKFYRLKKQQILTGSTKSPINFIAEPSQCDLWLFTCTVSRMEVRARLDWKAQGFQAASGFLQYFLKLGQGRELWSEVWREDWDTRQSVMRVSQTWSGTQTSTLRPLSGSKDSLWLMTITARLSLTRHTERQSYAISNWLNSLVTYI